MPKKDFFFFFLKSSQAPGGNLTVSRYFKCWWMCVGVCVRVGWGGSVHWAVFSLCVGVCVRAGGVHGDMGGADDDRSPLLLLGARSPLLSAFDVLDGLKRREEGKKIKHWWLQQIFSPLRDKSNILQWNDNLRTLYDPTCTIVSRFCLDVDTVLVWTDGLMVTTVTWWWGCWVSVGAGTMTVGWWVGAGGVGGANTCRQKLYE